MPLLMLFAKNHRKYCFGDKQTGLAEVRNNTGFFTLFELTVRFMVLGFVVFC